MKFPFTYDLLQVLPITKLKLLTTFVQMHKVAMEVLRRTSPWNTSEVKDDHTGVFARQRDSVANAAFHVCSPKHHSPARLAGTGSRRRSDTR